MTACTGMRFDAQEPSQPAGFQGCHREPPAASGPMITDTTGSFRGSLAPCVRRRFAAALISRLSRFGNSIPGHTTRVPPIGFVLATDDIRFYVIANLDKRRFAAALLPRLFGTSPRSHHKGATGRVRTGNQRLPVLCHCQLGQAFLNIIVNTL